MTWVMCMHNTVGACVPEAEQAGIPVHEDVSEVLEDGGEINPEYPCAKV